MENFQKPSQNVALAQTQSQAQPPDMIFVKIFKRSPLWKIFKNLAKTSL
nr:hypothetical protein [uncultured Campylobacter sp.]